MTAEVMLQKYMHVMPYTTAWLPFQVHFNKFCFEAGRAMVEHIQLKMCRASIPLHILCASVVDIMLHFCRESENGAGQIIHTCTHLLPASWASMHTPVCLAQSHFASS